MGWPTAQTVVTQAALELGLIQSLSAWGEDVYASLDSSVAQMLALLKKAGRDLVDEFDWSHLRQEYGLYTGAGGQTWASYALPPDWKKMIDQSGWNRTQRLPMGGPLSEQEWQYLASRLTGVVFTVLFRPMQHLIQLYPPTAVPAGQSINFAYKSSWWVLDSGSSFSAWADLTAYKPGALVYLENAAQPFLKNYYRCVSPGTSNADPPGGLTNANGASGPIYAANTSLVWNWVGASISTAQGIQLTFGTADVPAAGSNLLLLDEELLVAKLKLLWLKAKGFDSRDAEGEYERAFMQATSNDSPAPILNLNGRGFVSDRLLGGFNVPITGFGS